MTFLGENTDVLGPETVLCSVAEGTLPMSLRSRQAMQARCVALQSQASRENTALFFFFKIYLFLIFGHTLQHVRSQFPDQGSNPQPLH